MTADAGRSREAARLALAYWAPFVAYVGLIQYLSTMSNPPAIPFIKWDKALHFIEFLILAVLTSRALHHTFPPLSLSWVVILAGVFGFLYGTVDEYRQSYIPGRTAEFLDAFADAAGAFAGAAVYVGFLALLHRLWRRQLGIQEERRPY